MKIKEFLFLTFFCLCQLCGQEQILLSNFSESDFERVERVFSANTGHIDNLVDFVCRRVLKNHYLKSFLDVGSGPATITSRLVPFFQTTTVIDPNKAYVPIYQSCGIDYYTANFQDLPIENKYDFILCSHVLYHVPKPEWKPFLKKMIKLIRKGGSGLLVMVAPKGKFHELRAAINPHYSNSSQVESILKKWEIAYERIPVRSTFRVNNEADFRALVRLFTLDDCYLPHEYQALSDSQKIWIEQKINDFIISCRQPDGSFDFVDEDVYLLLHRR